MDVIIRTNNLVNYMSALMSGPVNNLEKVIQTNRCQSLVNDCSCENGYSCISDVKAWATANMLKLNKNKTELMLVTFKRTKHLHNLPTSITIGNVQIPFKLSVKNLGFTLHCHLTMNAHVSNIARTCYFELHRLASIRRFLTSTATATLVLAFVLSTTVTNCCLVLLMM